MSESEGLRVEKEWGAKAMVTMWLHSTQGP